MSRTSTRNSIWLRGRRWLLSFAVLAAVVGAGLAARAWLEPQVMTLQVEQRDLVQSVVASGHVEAPHRVDVGAQITGTVARVPVAEGESVQKGQLLVELESAELAATARQADIAVIQAQEHLRQLRELQEPVARQALRQAQAILANANSQLKRNQDLFRQGFIGEAALEDSRKAVELADAQMHTAAKQLETLRPAGSEHALAESALAAAQASAQAARARAGYTRISAPAAGTLIARDVEVGDVVQPGKVLMMLSPAGRTQLVLDIDERNLRLLALGQHALASADAYPKQRFAAELAYINPGVNAQTGAVQVKLDVPAPPPTLKQDMTVSVDIEIARRPQALVVPATAVHDADGPSPWVLRVQEGRAQRQAVRLGLRSGGWCEVLEGLAAGDPVVPSAAAVSAGSWVRVIGPTGKR